MFCPKCKEKVDRAEVAKVACADCGSFFHAPCANVTAEDLDFMRANGTKHRCEPCTVSRRKSLHQQPLPATISAIAADDASPASGSRMGTQAILKSTTAAQNTQNRQKQTTNSSQKQQTQKTNNHNNVNVHRNATKQVNVQSNNNTIANKTEQIKQSQQEQVNIDGDRNTKEITMQMLYEEIINLKKVNSNFLATIGQLKEENEKLSERVCKLESVLNWREQQLLSSAVDISGVPALTNENANECAKQILGTALSLSLSPGEITKCFVKKFKKTNVLRIHFASSEVKNKVMTQKRKAKGKLTAKLFSDDHKNNIFINDSLTGYNRALLAVARKTKEAKSYKYLWVKNGRILLKKEDDGEVVLLKTFDDLSKVI